MHIMSYFLNAYWVEMRDIKQDAGLLGVAFIPMGSNGVVLEERKCSQWDSAFHLACLLLGLCLQ